MKILVVTDQAIGPSHGTGTLLMRYFGDEQSVQVFNVCSMLTADSGVFPTAVLPDRSGGIRRALGKLRRLEFSEIPGIFSNHSYESAVRKTLDFDPDLLWVIVCSRGGLRVAADVVQRFPGRSVYCSFWDLVFLGQLDQPRAKQNLEYLCQRALRIDAISDPLAREITRRTGRAVDVENFFCADLPERATIDRLVSAGDCRLVIVGNIWIKDAYRAMLQVIEKARSMSPQVGEIVWYCHASSLARLGISERRMPLGLVPGGHLAQGLTRKLLDFDLCIVPINGSRSRAEGYCRYSIPSRVSELFAAGVPIFSIGDSGSAFAEYLEQTGAGVHASAEPLNRAASKLVELIESPELRRAMGLAGRSYAEAHFESVRFRAKLMVRLESIWRSNSRG
jgi:glycosyltransferase involved in cell wall biosynthesis